MARYIDADKLDTRERGNNSQRTMWHEIKRIVDNAPTADVVPKSEVEELLTRLNTAYEKIDIAEYEVERLEKEVDRLSQCVLYHDGQIADAIKEFADRVCEKATSLGSIRLVCCETIEKLVKEMTESGGSNEN